jgi:hypothetical protein
MRVGRAHGGGARGEHRCQGIAALVIDEEDAARRPTSFWSDFQIARPISLAGAASRELASQL